MSTEYTSSDDRAEGEHAQLFDKKAREVIGDAHTFADKIAPDLTRCDAARMYLAAAVWLAAPVVERAGAIWMLRDLADQLERGRPAPN